MFAKHYLSYILTIYEYERHGAGSSHVFGQNRNQLINFSASPWPFVHGPACISPKSNQYSAKNQPLCARNFFENVARKAGLKN